MRCSRSAGSIEEACNPRAQSRRHGDLIMTRFMLSLCAAATLAFSSFAISAEKGKDSMSQETAKAAVPARDPLEVHDADFAAKFDDLYGKTWGGGAIPAKYKKLIGV